MTTDDNKAGLANEDLSALAQSFGYEHRDCNPNGAGMMNDLFRLLRIVQRAEREACARWLDEHAAGFRASNQPTHAWDLEAKARQIRAADHISTDRVPPEQEKPQ